MPSLIPNYEYDIFISYRHNDNRSGWVTDFVNALQEELAAIIKEPLSIYFDKNPHDGLLETHNVDKSLEGKLKCLIFIPILSQTYCDPNSFAWQHEFCAFNNWAKEDLLGRDIKLGNGNVASRILPIKIHDLDAEDKLTIENEIGGGLRAIEFIYKSPGVNRPLTSSDKKDDNAGKVFFRDQINKTANSIKELVAAIKNPQHSTSQFGHTHGFPVKTKINKPALTIIGILLIVLGYFAYNQIRSEDSTSQVRQSIAVLPFVDLSPSHDQEYLGIGLMDEILNHLTKIGDLSPVSRTSSIIYANSGKTIKDIAKELNVANVLEGSVSKSGNKIKITAQLIDAATDRHLWSDTYEREFTDIFKIESDVAQKVANSLSAHISSQLKKQIEFTPQRNQEAYDLFLRANAKLTQDEDIIPMLERVIELDPNYSQAYSALAFRWELKGYWAGTIDPNEVKRKMEHYISKAIELDSTNAHAFSIRSQMNLFFLWNFQQAMADAYQVERVAPSYADVGHTFQLALCANKKFDEALKKSQFYFNLDKNVPGNWVGLANSYFYAGQPEKAIETLEAANRFLNVKYLSNENEVVIELGQLKIFTKDWTGALEIFEPFTTKGYPLVNGYLGIAYAHLKEKDKAVALASQLHKASAASSLGSPAYFAAAVHVALKQNDEAIFWLNKGYENHEVEMYWLNVTPIFDPLRNDDRFKEILVKVGFK